MVTAKGRNKREREDAMIYSWQYANIYKEKKMTALVMEWGSHKNIMVPNPK
jgi:hypothetical protein